MVRKDTNRNSPKEVDEYLSDLPDDKREILEELRSIVHEVVPNVKERVSYGIPMFRTKRDLVGISASKAYCSLHSLSPGLLKDLEDDFPQMMVSGATVHLKPGKPVDKDNIISILKRRVEDIQGS